LPAILGLELERIDNLKRALQGLLNRKHTFRKALDKCLAFDIFHHREIDFRLIASN